MNINMQIDVANSENIENIVRRLIRQIVFEYVVGTNTDYESKLDAEVISLRYLHSIHRWSNDAPDPTDVKSIVIYGIEKTMCETEEEKQHVVQRFCELYN